jgi:hypothetical protein
LPNFRLTWGLIGACGAGHHFVQIGLLEHGIAWYDRTALTDLLGTDADLAEIHELYACHDRLLTHKTALFSHLQQRWRDLFNAKFDVLLCQV